MVLSMRRQRAEGTMSAWIRDQRALCLGGGGHRSESIMHLGLQE